MSAATPAQNQVRRNAAAAPSRSPLASQQAPAPASVRQVGQVPQMSDFFTPRGEDEIRLNLSDLPVIRGTLDVEGLKPSLLSRLLDLIAPLGKR